MLLEALEATCCRQQNCCQFVVHLLLDTKGYMLRDTGNMLPGNMLLVAGNVARPRNMLLWCKSGLTPLLPAIMFACYRCDNLVGSEPPEARIFQVPRVCATCFLYMPDRKSLMFIRDGICEDIISPRLCDVSA